MSNKKLEQQEESDVRCLSKALIRQGVTVRREKLARGREYRVKSGRCSAFGASMLFVDRALPVAQQAAVLIDFCVENRISLYRGDVKQLSTGKLSMLDGLLSDIKPTIEAAIVEEIAEGDPENSLDENLSDPAALPSPV